MLTADELRLIVAEEIDLALRPVREVLVRLVDLRVTETPSPEFDAGVRASRIALLTRHAKIRADHGAAESPMSTPAIPVIMVEPVASKPRHKPALTVPECPRCGSEMIGSEFGLMSCPLGRKCS